MKSVFLVFIGIVLGWVGTNMYSGYLAAQVSNDFDGDFYAICEELLNGQ